MSVRDKALAALQKTFRLRTVSVECREGDRYWVSNGQWLAYVHRGELHHLLPTLPVNAFGTLAQLSPGQAVSFTEEGAQLDFGGMFPVLEIAYKQERDLTVLPALIEFGDSQARVCVVDDRMIFVNPRFFDNVRRLVEPERITADDEASVIGFWKDGEVIGAVMPLQGPEVEARDSATRILACRWRPDGNGEAKVETGSSEKLQTAIEGFLDTSRKIVGDEGSLSIRTADGEEHQILGPVE